MPDTDAIVGIYGAVDRAVRDDHVARLHVAQLLPQYRDPKLQWYDEFLEWLAETAPAENSKPAFPELGEALSKLAEEPPARARMRARRMFAIAIAVRAFPQMSDPESGLRASAIAALRMLPDDAVEREQRAVELYELLAGGDRSVRPFAADHPGTKDWWKYVVETADDEHMIPNKIGMFPQPCAGRWVKVPGIDGPVDALRTEHDTEPKEIAFDRATRFIEPVNWKTCMPGFWCDMHVTAELPSAGRRTYHEVVSTHCGDPARPGFWAETDLLFNFMWVPDKRKAKAAVANYELAGKPGPNDRILVDEGTLVVSKLGGGKLRVTTTKRIKFGRAFPSGAIALIMCAFGYGDIAGGLLACAAASGKDPNGGTDFPGVPPTAPAPTGSPGSGGPSGAGQTGAGGLVQDALDIWARALREGTTALARGVGGAGQQGRPTKPNGPGS